MSNYLNLRIANSPYGDVTKGSVLTQTELDDNFIYLKGSDIITATTSGSTIILTKTNGDTIPFDFNVSGVFTGGTVTGPTNFTNGVSANTFTVGYTNFLNDINVTGSINANQVTTNTISATNWIGLPKDIFVTGGTYNSGTSSITFTNNSGGTFNVTNISSGSGTFSGGTVTGATQFTGGLTSTTISATTYLGLPISFTGGSYSNGAITFNNSTGGTYSVTIPSNYAAGVISGASGWSAVSPPNGQINLPAVKVALYNNANNIEPIAIYDVPSGTTGVGGISALTNNDTNYIVIEYNGGSPRYSVSTVDTVNDSSIVLYMVVYRLNNFVHTLEFGNQGAGLANKLNDRFIMTDRFGYESGLTLGLSGSTGVITLSAGVAWNGPNRQSLDGLNSIDDFLFKNYHISGSWTADTSGDYINNTYYDNGTNIVAATAGKYLVNWYYRGQEINDHIYEVYGNSEYDTVALAEASAQPALPELITSHAFLVGRIIVGVGATTGITQTAFGPVFQSSGNFSSTSVHNNLDGLQGGTSGEYYHLTQTQYSNLALTNTTNTFTQQQTFSGGLSATSMSATSLYINGSVFTGDTYVNGFSYNNANVITLSQNNGQSTGVTINTMTGLTVNGNITFTGQSNNPIFNAGSGAVVGSQVEITLDFNKSSIQTVTLTGLTKFNSPSNIKDGAIYTLVLKQDSVGGWNVNWFTPTFKWENGTLPAITTTANAVDLITFISDGTSLYGIIAKNFS